MAIRNSSKQLINLSSIYFLLRSILTSSRPSALWSHRKRRKLFATVKLLADDDSDLRLYMKRKTSFVSPQAQNEIEEMYCHTILKKLASNIQIFAVVVGGIHGITSAEQEPICTRYVDTDLNVHETFIERYNIPYTTGDTISNMVFDVLMRLNLPLSGLRAQTYDGAANMSRAYNGCQAKVKEQQPLSRLAKPILPIVNPEISTSAWFFDCYAFT